MSKNHHDNREHFWNISLDNTENEMAEKLRAQTGLTKAEFGRQSLTMARVVSRVSADDRKMLKGLSHMRADIDRLVHICEKAGVEKAQKSILNIENMFCELYNYLTAKIG